MSAAKLAAGLCRHPGSGLELGLLAELKPLLKSGPAAVQEVYEQAMKHLATPNSQIRMLAFLLTDYVFSRSAYFRQLVCADIGTLVQRVTRDLPPPLTFASSLERTAVRSIHRWQLEHGEKYKQLRLGYEHLRRGLGARFDLLLGERDASAQLAAQLRAYRAAVARFEALRSEFAPDEAERLLTEVTALRACLDESVLPDGGWLVDSAPERERPADALSEKESDDGVAGDSGRGEGGSRVDRRAVTEFTGGVVSAADSADGVPSTAEVMRLSGIDASYRLAVPTGPLTAQALETPETAPVFSALRDALLQIQRRFLPAARSLVQAATAVVSVRPTLTAEQHQQLQSDYTAYMASRRTPRSASHRPVDPFAAVAAAPRRQQRREDAGVEPADRAQSPPPPPVPPVDLASLNIGVTLNRALGVQRQLEAVVQWCARLGLDASLAPERGQDDAAEFTAEPTAAGPPAAVESQPAAVPSRQPTQPILLPAGTDRATLLALAPCLTPGDPRRMLLEMKKVPLSMSGLDTSHRFLGSRAAENVELDTRAVDLHIRAVMEREEFVPVRWVCRAPVPAPVGGLCTRQDRVRCPLHGVVVPRDSMGNPNGPTTERYQLLSEIQRQNQRDLFGDDPPAPEAAAEDTGRAAGQARVPKRLPLHPPPDGRAAMRRRLQRVRAASALEAQQRLEEAWRDHQVNRW